MRQCLVKKKLYRYTNQCYKSQLLERIVTMAAQWFQPDKDIFYSRVEASLDNIALEVLDCLRKNYPNHSICSTAFSQFFSYWKNNNIDDNYWNEAEGTQIIDTLREYMIDKFRSNKWGMSANTKLEYMCIDNVSYYRLLSIITYSIIVMSIIIIILYLKKILSLLSISLL